jgi:hypothetical protein
LKLPERQDFLDYAEGALMQDAKVQRQILGLMASSPMIREQVLELKKDLYLISAQIPDYNPEAQFGAEVAKLAQSWMQILYRRKFSLQNFYRSREFFGVILLLAATLLLLLAMLGNHAVHL